MCLIPFTVMRCDGVSAASASMAVHCSSAGPTSSTATDAQAAGRPPSRPRRSSVAAGNAFGFRVRPRDTGAQAAGRLARGTRGGHEHGRPSGTACAEAHAHTRTCPCPCRRRGVPPPPPLGAHKSARESANPRTDLECASGCPWSTARATAPSPGRPTPGLVKQDKSSGGSIDTTKTRSGPRRV